MTLDLKQQISDAPRALRETLEKGRSEFESVVRRVRWGEGPVFMLGTGAAYLAALSGVRAFETLLGWPVIARTASTFAADASTLLRPHSVVLAISSSGESPETLDAAGAASARGAVVLGVTNNPASALAKLADLVLLLRGGDAGQPTLQTVLCQQAALGYLSLVTARTLKRHHHQFDLLEEQFAELPGLIEWVHAQLLNAIRALAAELKAMPNLSIVGGGFYYPIALQAALHLKELAAVPALGSEAVEPEQNLPVPAQETGAVLFLSGSHCRAKKTIHALAHQAKRRNIKVFSVTDSNDRELSNSSEVSVLLPELTEMVGCTLTLSLLQSVALHATRLPASNPAHP